MKEATHTLHFGDTAIEYTLTYAARKTLAIHVHPDRSVTVKAPAGSDLAAVEGFLRKRAPWVLRKQAEFAALPPKQPPRRYVSGESFSYLGRHYRLKVSEGEREWVKLARGYLEVTTPNKADTAYVQAQVEVWLRRQAQRHLHERVVALLPRFKPLALAEPELAVRAMKSRWGSCTGKGKITLNLHLMRAPRPCIDYVVVHELCHLVEHNHGKGFYALMDRVMPEWRKRREELKQVEIV
jgi:predicted metal-dependent hydrolase